MREIVINSGIGGFGLSDKALQLLHERGVVCSKHEKSIAPYNWSSVRNQNLQHDIYCFDHCLERDDPRLVEVVRELREDADGDCATLRIILIPEHIDWAIGSGDTGAEWVYEKHRTWSWPEDGREYLHFYHLVKVWETSNDENAFNNLVKMGANVIPFIARNLRTAPSMTWVLLLNKITGEDPVAQNPPQSVPGEDFDLIDATCEIWWRWLLQNDYRSRGDLF